MSQINFQTNIQSLIAQNAFNKSTNLLQKAMTRLSTGLRINSAVDDPAGLVISSRLSTQIAGSTQALDNIQIGQSVINIAEGGLTSISNDLARIRELCVQAANSFYTTDANNAMLQEMQCRIDNINQTAQSCGFNGVNLLDGTLTSMRIQVGFGSDVTTNTVDLASSLQNCQSGTDGLDIDLADNGLYLNTATADDFANYISKLDTAISTISTYRSDIGAKYNKLDATYTSMNTYVENQTAARSTILDANIAQESSNLVRAQIMQQSTLAALTQANSLPQVVLNLLNNR